MDDVVEQPRVKYPPEFADLDRDDVPAYGASHCRQISREIIGSVETEETTVALSRYLQGGRVAELLLHKAPAVLDCRTVDEFLATYCGMDSRRASEVVTFARGATDAEAVKYGWTRGLLGIRIAKQLGVATLTALEERTLRYRDKEGKEQRVRFGRGTPVSVLRKVLAQLPVKDDEAADAEPSDRLRRKARRIEAVVERHAEKNPVVLELGVKVAVYEGDVRVRNGPVSTPEQFAAAAALFEELAKLR